MASYSESKQRPLQPSYDRETSHSDDAKYQQQASKSRQKATNWSVQETSIFLAAWRSLYQSLETASYREKNTIWNLIFDQYRSRCVNDGISVDRTVHQLKKRIQNLTYQFKQFRGPTTAKLDEESRTRVNKVFPYFDFLERVFTSNSILSIESKPVTKTPTTEPTLTVFAYDDPGEDRVRRRSALNTPEQPETPDSDSAESSTALDNTRSEHAAEATSCNYMNDTESHSSSQDESESLVVVDIHKDCSLAKRNSESRKPKRGVKKAKVSHLDERFSMNVFQEMWQSKLDQDKEHFDRLLGLQREALQTQVQQTNAILNGLTNILNILVKK